MSNFGDELRRERELRQISLREVSESTKISLRHLEALERNDFQHLPGGVFNRGFVRAYSEFIGIDADSMVDAYLLEEREQLARGDDDGTPAGRRALRDDPAKAQQAAPPGTTGSRGLRALAWLVGLLLLVAAAIAVWWFLLRGPGGSPLGTTAPLTTLGDDRE
jgi:cytoskeletal protein RodZ